MKNISAEIDRKFREECFTYPELEANIHDDIQWGIITIYTPLCGEDTRFKNWSGLYTPSEEYE